MGLVSAIVRLQDTTISHDPVVGVVIRVYDDSDVFVVQETTDSTGKVDVTLDGAASPGNLYYVRAYKPGCSFGGPWQVRVQDPVPLGEDNDWMMSVDVFAVPGSPNPGMCRVAGQIVDPSGNPFPSAFISFTPQYDGLIPVHYDRLMAGVIQTNADDDGYVSVDLPRGGMFAVEVAELTAVCRKVTIPDRSGILLADLLFPVPERVDFDPAGPWSVPLGTNLVVVPAITASNYADWGRALEQVDYTVVDPTIASVGTSDFNGVPALILRGLSGGSTTLEVTPKAGDFHVVPARTIVGGSVGIIVA